MIPVSLITPITANITVVAFTAAFSVTAFLFYRRRGNTVAEAGAYGLMTTLMVQSWVSQVLFIFGVQRLYMWVQAILLLAAVVCAVRERRILVTHLHFVLRFIYADWLPAYALLSGWLLMAAMRVFPSASAAAQSADLLHLSSLLGWVHYHAGMSLPVLNCAILTAPWQPSLTVGLANMVAYISIGSATYALARRYAWPPTAITVVLLVVSMPRLVHQSLTLHSELLPAAAVVLAILALYRTVEQPHPHDLVMLATTITYSVSGGRLCYLMPLVLTALSLVVLARRHGFRLWAGALFRNPVSVVTALAVGLIFCQLGVVAFNLANGFPWMGSAGEEVVFFNADGLAGAGANLIRYLLQSVHLPEFVDHFCRWAFDASPLDGLNTFYRQGIVPVLDGRGAAESFAISWTKGDGMEWFGPAGFLLILPALLYALWGGSRRLKSTALAMLVYGLLIALIPAWRAANVQWLTPLFAGCGFFSAFFLPPWRIGRTGCRVLQVLSLGMWVYALL
jgi:hypothetical protein